MQSSLDRVRQCLEDLWDDVLGRDPVDVVAAGRLQLQHHLAEPNRINAFPANLPGDVVVLAEDAAQVAAAEEDRPGAVPSPQAG